MDFRALLLKYMSLVQQNTGETYVGEAPFVNRSLYKLTKEEIAALQACEREALPSLRA
jgi:hypothetical protein